MNASLGTKRHCPECATRFYDLGALEVRCPKCAHPFEMVRQAVAAPAVSVAAPLAEKPLLCRKTEQDDDEDTLEGMGELVELEDLDDFSDDDDFDHLEEVEEHHEDPEVDVNSDDAEDDMFIDELAEDDPHLIDEPDYEAEEREAM